MAVAARVETAAIAGLVFLTKRGVEKHVNAIFSKLDLPEEQAVSRRVFATLLYLSDRAPEPGEPIGPDGI